MFTNAVTIGSNGPKSYIYMAAVGEIRGDVRNVLWLESRFRVQPILEKLRRSRHQPLNPIQLLRDSQYDELVEKLLIAEDMTICERGGFVPQDQFLAEYLRLPYVVVLPRDWRKLKASVLN